MNLLIAVLVKPAIILGLTLAFLPLLRKQSAAVRHLVLSCALVCAAAAPLLAAVLPGWRLPAVVSRTGIERPQAGPGTGVTFSIETDLPSSTPPGVENGSMVSSRTNLAAMVRWVWLVGSLPFLLALSMALFRLRRLASSARQIESGVWVDCARRIGRQYGFARPVILLEARTRPLLVTWGVRRPSLILPPGCQQWSTHRASVVLMHELAHIRRGDWVLQLAGELLCAVYWFNPFFWLAARRLREESEFACDDEVLARGVQAPDYAGVLLGVTRELRQPRLPLPAPAMARSSNLERRVRAMLAINVDRRPVSRASVALTVLALLAVSLPAAGFSAAQTTGIVAGSIVDPSNAALPGVKVVLTGTRNGRTHEARTNAAGRYELAGVAPGEYELTASLPGFATATQSISVSAGQAVSRDLAMEIGSLQETITVSGRNQTEAYSTAVSGRSVEEMRAERAADCTAGAPVADGTLRVGGNLRAPRKLKDVRPIYPEHLRTAGTGGTVLLEARIGTDGNVSEVNVVSAPHPDLGASAADAVRQWQFDATLLNCRPVEVSMKVTVNFDHER